MTDLHPAYRAHLEWALFDVGFIAPRVTDDGDMLFVPLEKDADGQWNDDREPILSAGRETNVNLIAVALAQADAASCSTTGREILQSLADGYRVADAEAEFEVVLEAHRGNLQYCADSHRFVARRLSAQAKGKDIEVGW